MVTHGAGDYPWSGGDGSGQQKCGIVTWHVSPEKLSSVRDDAEAFDKLLAAPAIKQALADHKPRRINVTVAGANSFGRSGSRAPRDGAQQHRYYNTQEECQEMLGVLPKT